MSVIKAAIKGLGQVLTSPGLVLWLWLVNVLAALPLSMMMAGSIRDSIGASLVYEKLRDGFDLGWYGEYESRAKGIETTLSPTVTGVGPFLDNLESWLNGDLFELMPGLVVVGVLYGLLWAFFLGGVLHRFGDGAGLFRFSEFFSHGGTFFFRFLRLTVLSGVLYYLVYRFSGWLFGRIAASTRDVAEEKTVLGYVILASLLVAFLLTFIHMVFDYAKIATFRENRRSMLLAAVKGFGFVLANLAKALPLYYGLAALGALLLAAYWTVAPGPGQSTAAGVLVAFLVGQVYLIAKLALRLTFYSSQMSLFDAVASR